MRQKDFNRLVSNTTLTDDELYKLVTTKNTDDVVETLRKNQKEVNNVN